MAKNIIPMHTFRLTQEGPGGELWETEIKTRERALAYAQWLYTLAELCAEAAERLPGEDEDTPDPGGNE